MIKKIHISKKYFSYGIFLLILGIIFIISIKIINNWWSILNNFRLTMLTFFNIISPIFYGFLVAYVLFRPTILIQKYYTQAYQFISKRNITVGISKILRILSILTVFTLLWLFFTILINFVIPPIIDNIKILLNNLPQYQEQINIWINEFVIYLKENNIDISPSGELSAFFSKHADIIGNYILSISGNVLSGFTSFIVEFIFTIIFTFYFIKDKELLFNNFRKIRDVLFPPKFAYYLTVFINDLDEIVGKFLIGQLIATIVVGFISAILMLIIKHPFAILIGTVAGVTNIIPLVGPIIGALFAFILGVFSSLSLGIWGAALLILYQQVDGNFVQPKIVGDRIGLAPIWILIVVLIGGKYFGALGMILSMPVAGLIRMYFIRYSEYKKIMH